jgi:succinate dehydrogenase flavin-adding protein (antitoxin of CptAB toxin-antitoxin module)
MDFLEKELHPVIEEFVNDYTEERLTTTERDTFEEVLVTDDQLRELAFSAKDGKNLMERLRVMKSIQAV